MDRGTIAASARDGASLATLRTQGLSPMGIGCARFGSLSSATEPDELAKLFEMAVANGITMFDTAGLYGGGASEQMVGAHARRHPGTYVMTKVGRRQTATGSLAHSLRRWTRPMIGRYVRGLAAALRSKPVRTDFSAGALQLAMVAAQQRLGGARSNAVLLHSPPVHLLKDLGVRQALLRFRTGGWADHIGVSCDDIAVLRAARRMSEIDIVQMPIGLYRQARVEGLIDGFMEAGVALVVRGIIGDRGGASVCDAVAAAGDLPGVFSVLVGVSTPAHLADIVGPSVFLPT